MISLGTMRVRRLAGLIASLTMTHFVLVTGEVECARAPITVSEQPASQTAMTDCEHAGAPAPTHSRAPERHTREHGSLCCAALAGCAAVFGPGEHAAAGNAALSAARINNASPDAAPAPHFPPEPPPPKA